METGGAIHSCTTQERVMFLQISYTLELESIFSIFHLLTENMDTSK